MAHIPLQIDATFLSVVTGQIAHISLLDFSRCGCIAVCVVFAATDVAARGGVDRGKQAHHAGCTLYHDPKESQHGSAAHLLLRDHAEAALLELFGV